MANTTYLNLVKPDYTDDADIEDINENSEKIDAFAGNTIGNVGGTDFSTSSTYQVGQIVKYNGKLYKCVTAVTTAGAWSASNWEEVSLQDEIDTLGDHIAEIPASTTCNSLDNVKTYLTGVMDSMVDNEIRTVHILTGSSFTGGYFKSSLRYSGHVVRFASGQISFDFTSRDGDIVNGGLLTSTWTFYSKENNEKAITWINASNNFNDCTDPNKVYAWGNVYPTNYPFTNGRLYNVGGTDTQTQIALANDATSLAVRMKNSSGGSWTGWTHYATIVYVQSSSAITKNGGTGTIAYPTGYNRTNCAPVYSMLYVNSTGPRYFDDNAAATTLTDNGIVVVNKGGADGYIIVGLTKLNAAP